ncbi:MAG: pyrimidine 5'-nucleotidase [Alphaproteobacteria bacterium]|nr:pyrimidine 5'-nucleotidase [Alphaproteobacteria bacterium]
MPDIRHQDAHAGVALKAAFEGIDHWIFDLDNTLYPAECNLFRQIDARMASFIEARLGLGAPESRRLQKDYYVRYGTTLNGLMHEHDVPPEDFLSFVHDIDLSVVARNDRLAALIGDLPGRKFVFTNGTLAHAENVIDRLGLDGAFDDIVDIVASGYAPKPHGTAYRRFIDRVGALPEKSAMFEDIAINLQEPSFLGMRTVLVASEADWMADEPSDRRPARKSHVGELDYIHHVTDDLAAFLGGIAPAGAEEPEWRQT